MASSKIAKFSYVGLSETLEHDCALILSALSIPSPETYKRINITNNKKNIDDVSRTLKEKLMELTMLDRKLYDLVIESRKCEKLNKT